MWKFTTGFSSYQALNNADNYVRHRCSFLPSPQRANLPSVHTGPRDPLYPSSPGSFPLQSSSVPTYPPNSNPPLLRRPPSFAPSSIPLLHLSPSFPFPQPCSTPSLPSIPSLSHPSTPKAQLTPTPHLGNLRPYLLPPRLQDCGHKRRATESGQGGPVDDAACAEIAKDDEEE